MRRIGLFVVLGLAIFTKAAAQFLDLLVESVHFAIHFAQASLQRALGTMASLVVTPFQLRASIAGTIWSALRASMRPLFGSRRRTVGAPWYTARARRRAGAILRWAVGRWWE